MSPKDAIQSIMSKLCMRAVYRVTGARWRGRTRSLHFRSDLKKTFIRYVLSRPRCKLQHSWRYRWNFFDRIFGGKLSMVAPEYLTPSITQPAVHKTLYHFLCIMSEVISNNSIHTLSIIWRQTCTKHLFRDRIKLLLERHFLRKEADLCEIVSRLDRHDSSSIYFYQ